MVFIKKSNILTEEERRLLLVEWNDTTRDYPQGECLHQEFESQVERAPNAVAVTCGDRRLTYGELNRRANQVARDLRQRGVGPEVLVGLYMERSLEMMVAILGILKAGGAYVPLDPAYPRERLAFMVADTRASILLTQEHLAPDFPDVGWMNVRPVLDKLLGPPGWQIAGAAETCRRGRVRRRCPVRCDRILRGQVLARCGSTDPSKLVYPIWG